MRVIEFLLDVWSKSQSPSQLSTPSSSVLQVDERFTPTGGCLAKHRDRDPRQRGRRIEFLTLPKPVPLGGERTTQGLGVFARRCGTSVGASEREAPVTLKR